MERNVVIPKLNGIRDGSFSDFIINNCVRFGEADFITFKGVCVISVAIHRLNPYFGGCFVPVVFSII